MLAAILLMVCAIPAIAESREGSVRSCMDAEFILYARGGYLSHTYYVYIDGAQGRISFWEAQTRMFLEPGDICGLDIGRHEPKEGVSGMIGELDKSRWQTELEYFQKTTADWEATYFNPDIQDGTQWRVLTCTGNAEECVEYAGSNAYPPNFEQLRKHLKELYKEFGGNGTIPF
jgi:hypothetical protein